MSDNNQQNQKHHVYDGIIEHDNALPNWWLVTFFGTIIFAFVYYVHYTFGGGATLTQELAAQMQALPKQQAGQFDEGDLEKKFAALNAKVGGKEIFAGKCAACHGNDGQGVIGPNLTDKFWIHGKGHRADIMKTISDGVVEKGMPAWAASLKEEELLKVAGYVFALRENPKTGKEPQGEAE